LYVIKFWLAKAKFGFPEKSEVFVIRGACFKLFATEWQQEQLQKGVHLSSCFFLSAVECSALSFAQLFSHINGAKDSAATYSVNKNVKNFMAQK